MIDNGVRVQSPYGEHFVVWTEHAPDVETSEREYALMTRVRDWDRIYAPLLNGRKRSIDPAE